MCVAYCLASKILKNGKHWECKWNGKGRKECICERSNGNGEWKSEHKVGYCVKVKLADTVCEDGRRTKVTRDHVFVARQLETFPSVLLFCTVLSRFICSIFADGGHIFMWFQSMIADRDTHLCGTSR